MQEQLGNLRADGCSPLVLAYVGDAVYELYMRMHVLTHMGNCQVDKLHKSTTSLVKASAQCAAFHKIEQQLTPEELAVFKRGRNAKSAVPKHADVTDYRMATGMEALIGYIFLSGDQKRLREILDLIVL